jgi:hypothetical protein
VDVAAWLRSLGLEQYEPAFRDHGIDAEILPKLTVEDLKDIGVTRVGDRRKLLEATAALRVGAPPSPVVEQPAAVPAPLPQAERRQLTVMFCDLVGSTALSAPRSQGSTSIVSALSGDAGSTAGWCRRRRCRSA